MRCAPASHHLHPVTTLCCSRLVEQAARVHTGKFVTSMLDAALLRIPRTLAVLGQVSPCVSPCSSLCLLKSMKDWHASCVIIELHRAGWTGHLDEQGQEGLRLCIV